MDGEGVALSGPDLERGIPISDVPDGGMLLGHAHGEAVLVSRQGTHVFAVSATCTHYGAPLIDGLVVGDTVRCPWHHACFSLRTGDALRPPALKPLKRWAVEDRGGVITVRREPAPPQPRFIHRRAAAGDAAHSVVIVGAGAAGDAAADTLRREGYSGRITLIGADRSAPYDRPNISKDYLAGTAPEEWLPLRDPGYYRERGIDLVLGRSVSSIDRATRRVHLEDGSALDFGALLLATGASPVQLPASTHDGASVHYLRSLDDSQAIIAAAERSRRVAVVGASFIGLEVAAALRSRGLDVHVVAQNARPLETIMGPQVGEMIRALHEAHGVRFHMGLQARDVRRDEIILNNGQRIPADFVVAGIGVRPNDGLAADAGIHVDRGIVVDQFLETSEPGIFAAGDVARYRAARGRNYVRIEHWVVAQRQGQTAAHNILHRLRDEPKVPFDAVPFFWSRHYDVSINYAGHAPRWDQTYVSGSLQRHDASIAYLSGGEVLAVATVGRDRASLEAEVALEGVGLYMITLTPPGCDGAVPTSTRHSPRKMAAG